MDVVEIGRAPCFFFCYMKKNLSKAAGGIARAEALAPERRKAIAKAAAEARWSPPKATHQGVLDIGGASLSCFVLADGRRVISGRGLTAAIGMKGRGQGVARISEHKLIKHYKNNELAVAIENPIKFIPFWTSILPRNLQHGQSGSRMSFTSKFSGYAVGSGAR